MAEIHYVQEIKGLDMGTWPDHNHDLMTNAFECTSANQHLHPQMIKIIFTLTGKEGAIYSLN